MSPKQIAIVRALIAGVQATIWLFLGLLTVLGFMGVDLGPDTGALHRLFPKLFGIGYVSGGSNSTFPLLRLPGTGFVMQFVFPVLLFGALYGIGVFVDRAAKSVFHPLERWLRMRCIGAKLPSEREMRLDVASVNRRLDVSLDKMKGWTHILRFTSFNLALVLVAGSILFVVHSSAQKSSIVVGTAVGVVIVLLAVFIWAWVILTYYERLVRGYQLSNAPMQFLENHRARIPRR
ncbi:MAG: hypothetical protein WCV00_02460 [Verrucomicrobiia bacterium]|jgi:hypothetical protein